MDKKIDKYTIAEILKERRQENPTYVRDVIFQTGKEGHKAFQRQIWLLLLDEDTTVDPQDKIKIKRLFNTDDSEAVALARKIWLSLSTLQDYNI